MDVLEEHYEEVKDPEQMKAKIDKDPRINATQFERLIGEGESLKSKEKVVINKMNHKQKKLNHNIGMLSIANIHEEMTKELGRESTNMELMKRIYRNQGLVVGYHNQGGGMQCRTPITQPRLQGHQNMNNPFGNRQNGA